MDILKSGYDTLYLTTQEFYLNEEQLSELELARCIADERREKTSFFMSNMDSSRTYQFLMYPKNLKGYRYLFSDFNDNFLISVNTHENKYVLKVQVSSKVLFKKSMHEIVRELERVLITFFTVESVHNMKVGRIDYCVDVKAKKGTLAQYIKDNDFQSRYKMSMSTYGYQDHKKLQKESSYNCKSGHVFFRTYNKALELFEKYDLNPSKSALVLKNYLDINITEQNKELLKMDYENSDIEIIRIEYEFQKDYIKNKFKYVSDLLEYNVKDLVLKTFLNHTGLKAINQDEIEEEKKKQRTKTSGERKTYLDFDYKFKGLAKVYFQFLKEKSEVFVNNYKRVEGEVYQAIQYNYMKLKATLLNLYVAMSKRDNKEKSFNSFMNEVFESEEIATKFEYYLNIKKANKFNVKNILDKFNLDFLYDEKSQKRDMKTYKKLGDKFKNVKGVQLGF